MQFVAELHCRQFRILHAWQTVLPLSCSKQYDGAHCEQLWAALAVHCRQLLMHGVHMPLAKQQAAAQVSMDEQVHCCAPVGHFMHVPVDCDKQYPSWHVSHISCSVLFPYIIDVGSAQDLQLYAQGMHVYYAVIIYYAEHSLHSFSDNPKQDVQRQQHGRHLPFASHTSPYEFTFYSNSTIVNNTNINILLFPTLCFTTIYSIIFLQLLLSSLIYIQRQLLHLEFLLFYLLMQTMEPGLRSCQTTNDMRNMAEDNFSIEEMDQILGRMSGDSPNNDGNLNSNNDEEPQSQQNQHKNQANQEKPEQKTQECDQLGPEDISISKQEIFFGKTPLFPGTIQELDFSISLNSKQNSQNAKEEDNNRTYILRILAVCKNPEFDSLDQYVFSVRSNKYYEYYQEVRFKIKRGERADVKVAIKVPPVKQNYTIKGAIQIMLQNLQPISIPIIAQSSIPDIVCLKTLYKQDENTELIKVPAKKGMARTPPLPFKNLSPYNLTIQVQAIGAEDYSTKPYDIVTQNFVNCQANSLFFINMQLKENLNFVEPIPQRMTIRKILLLKIKNSTSFFHFPLEVCIFEGQMVQGN